MRRVLTGLALVAAAVGVAVLTGASDTAGSGGAKTYKIQFDNAFGLTTGGDLKVGGVRAGKTSGFELKKIGNGRYVAEVEGQVTEPGVAAFRKDASCEIRPQSLIGEYFVDCQPGSSNQPLGDGGVVPVKQTFSTVPPDLMQNVMRRPYRERFRLILSELGTGLAGRPEDLSEVLKRAHPGLRETSKVLNILANQNQIIKDFITNSDTVVAQLEARKKDVSHWVKAAGRTAEISSTRQQALRQQWQRFPGFLAELKPTMAQLGSLADEQTPLLRQLQDAAPNLEKFFADLGPFSDASRPSFRSLAKTADIGDKAFKDSKDEIAELKALAVNAPSTGRNLRQLLQSLDTRDRAIEPDVRAKESAPPAPDPNAYKDGQGFTGFEALLNYPYWQTLALNPFDQLGHLLRVVLFVNSCSEWQTGPVTAENKDVFEKCNSWLGPYQPGVTAPDPTDDPNSKSAVPEPKQAARKPGEVRGGDKQADKPLPGQTDPSKPRLVLPPAIQELLNSLPKIGADTPNLPNLPGGLPTGGGGAGSTAPDKLLDFLLAP
jgi:ABC-type transporter Mla subunit MlaD